MRFTSSVSIAVASHPTTTAVTNTPNSTPVASSDTSTIASRSDSGSDAGSHRGEDTRSIIRKHISFRPSRSQSPPKTHLLALPNPSTDHVSHSSAEAKAKSTGSSAALLKFQSRTRGLSSSSLLNPNPSITLSSVNRENLPVQTRPSRAGTVGGSADNPAHHHQPSSSFAQQEVDHSFIAATVSFPIYHLQFFHMYHPRLDKYYCCRYPLHTGRHSLTRGASLSRSSRYCAIS